MGSGLRVQRVDEPVAGVALVRVIRTQDAARLPKAGLSSAWRWADDQAGEFWETLSYAVIWLCGLIGIRILKDLLEK